MTPSTVFTWALNGTTVEFDVPFDYLSQTFVAVTLIGTTNQRLTLGTDYQFLSPTRIRLFRAYGPPQYNLIEVRRETSTTEKLVEFQDASILTSSDMNTADLQVMHVAEEARNAATETIGVNNEGNLDARGRRIVNVANPVGNLDAINVQYYKSEIGGVSQAKNDAVAAANSAEASQTAAAASATAASTSRTASAASEAKAKDWATKPTAVEGGLFSSSVYAGRAATSASEASSSAVSAGVSKADSASSAQLAFKWASNPENVVVTSGGYSAHHWALKAKGWADSASSMVLPDSSVSWEKLSPEVRNNVWLRLAGGTVTGLISMENNLRMGRYQPTNDSFYVSFTGGATDGAELVWYAKATTGGWELRAGANTSAARAMRVDAEKNVTVFGGLASTSFHASSDISAGGNIAATGQVLSGGKPLATSERVTALEAVKPVLKVNNTAPDASGNVSLSIPPSGVPLDSFGQVGQFAILHRKTAFAMSVGGTYAGSSFYWYGVGPDGVITGPSTPPGVWRLLGGFASGSNSAGLFQRIS